MRFPAIVLVLAGVVGAVPAAAAAPARTARLISAGSAPVQAVPAGISADGSRALFTTTEALVPADVNGANDVYARDTDGTLQLIGSGVGAGSFFAGVSADGDRTWFTTTNQELPSDTDAQSDIYERRRDGSLRQISAGNAAMIVQFVQASDDGDHVVFSTSEAVPGTGDGDAVADMYDRRGDGSIRLVTPGTAVAMNFFSNRNKLSADGSKLTFFTSESLVAGDLDGGVDSYSVPTAGGPYTLETPGTLDAPIADVNRAGTRAWFSTTTSLLPSDTDGGAADTYERRSDGSLHLVTGGTANVGAVVQRMLDDGSSAVFSTTEALLPTDTDGTGSDIYERRGDGSLHLISGGTSATASVFAYGINSDGGVVFETNESLLPADTDVVTDLYLRRPDGVLVLLTPGTAAAVSTVTPDPGVPMLFGRVVFGLSVDLPGTGDTNGTTDVYEATNEGLRPVIAGIPGGTNFSFAQTGDAARILFTTNSTIPGTGDNDVAVDVYEADFAVPVVTGVPTLTGTAKVGATHTCGPPAVAGEGVTTTFAWIRDATVLAGVTGATYKPVLADAGHALKCRVTARNGIGADTADSAARGILPAALAAKLAGFPIVGTSLGCTSFAGATSTRYTWKRGAKSVKGRKGRTYKVGSGDLGKRLTCTAVGKKGALATTVALKLTVPARCTVANARGLTPAAAKTKLGNAGCRSKTSKVAGAGVAKGLVLGTSPPKGAKRANGATITIRVRR